MYDNRRILFQSS